VGVALEFGKLLRQIILVGYFGEPFQHINLAGFHGK
jgi:hypothetical protein